MLGSVRAAARLSRCGVTCFGGRLGAQRSTSGLFLTNIASSSSPQVPATSLSFVHHSRFSTESSSSQQTPQQQQQQTDKQAQNQERQKKIPSLKTVLRRFYLVTHPDKFSDHPEAKAVNEHSLRDFLTYIEEYKKNPRGTALGKPRRIPLVFYIKDETTNALRKITTELISNSTNPSAAKRRLMNLFSLCGLESDFTFEHDVWIPPDTANLQDFLSSSLFHAKESLKKATATNTYINTIISDIERKYGFKLHMDTSAEAYYAPAENKNVIDKLTKVVANLQAEGWMEKGFIKGIEVGMDSESESCAQDAEGNIYLSRKEGGEEWELFLKRLDWNEVHTAKAKSTRNHNEEAKAKVASEEARSKKEEDLIKLLGVRIISVQSYNRFECQISGEPEKTKLLDEKSDMDDTEIEDFEKEAHGVLDRLLSEKQVFLRKNSKIAKKWKNVEIVFCPNMPSKQLYHISRTGKLRVSTKVTATELLDILTTKLAILQTLSLAEDKYSAIRDFVEVRLGLKVLTIDYSYYYTQENSLAQSRQAFDKLNKLSEKLRTHSLGGLTMAVSDHYGLNLDGSLFIKWDFSDEDAILLLDGAKLQQQQANLHQQQEGENVEEGAKKAEQ